MPNQPLSLPSFPTFSPDEQSPWQSLFANSGAPTPSIHNTFNDNTNSPIIASRFQNMSLAQNPDDLHSPPSSSPTRPLAAPSFSSTANRMLGGPSGRSLASRRANAPTALTTSNIHQIDPTDLPVPIPRTHLILDLRTHNSYTQSRIHTAVPITIPSTLLRRANFTLAKLVPMLDQESDRARLMEFQKGTDRITKIICYDQDGQAAGEGGTLAGLLGKFEKEGFKGKLCVIRGGFTAVQRFKVPGLVDTSLIKDHVKTSSAVNGRDLPMAAFQQVSANGAGALTAGLTLPAAQTSTTQTPGLQHRAANPFFDNIRQNVELSHGIGERIPLDLPSSTIQRAAELPPWLKDLILSAPSDAADTLAQQFYKVELGEQKRLQGIMNHHSKFGDAGGEGSNEKARADYFPYSITAGLEKGWKNRFQNIWPFDHARVRLEDKCDDDGSDYINASFVQPRATNKKYIATQGPLPSTYRDFWTLCWEQNVRVIVMLTKQHEGGQVKCGDYWSDRTFGPLTLQPLDVKGEEESPATNDGGGGFFAAATPKKTEPRPLIKRSFLLTHADHPDEPGRLITQIQYVSWPDFDIPETPEDLLNLIREVNQINEDAIVEAHVAGRSSPGPIVVHCSAGVGRTGSYVVVDAVLDAMKHEMQSKREAKTRRRQPFSPNHPLVFSSPPPVGASSPSFFTRPSGSPSATPLRGMDIDPSAAWYPSSDTSRSGSPTAFSDVDDPASSSQTGSSTSLVNLGNMNLGSSSTDGRRASLPFNIRHRPSFSSFHSTSSGLSRESSPPPFEPSASAVENGPGGLPPPRCMGRERDRSNTALSDLKEPILNVLEDMREQRMSLCQTLRQFVFAYRVIIQGTLDLVEEERREGSSLDSTEDRKRHADENELEGARGGLTKRPSLKLPKVRARRPSKASSVLEPIATVCPLASSTTAGEGEGEGQTPTVKEPPGKKAVYPGVGAVGVDGNEGSSPFFA